MSTPRPPTEHRGRRGKLRAGLQPFSPVGMSGYSSSATCPLGGAKTDMTWAALVSPLLTLSPPGSTTTDGKYAARRIGNRQVPIAELVEGTPPSARSPPPKCSSPGLIPADAATNRSQPASHPSNSTRQHTRTTDTTETASPVTKMNHHRPTIEAFESAEWQNSPSPVIRFVPSLSHTDTSQQTPTGPLRRCLDRTRDHIVNAPQETGRARLDPHRRWRRGRALRIEALRRFSRHSGRNRGNGETKTLGSTPEFWFCRFLVGGVAPSGSSRRLRRAGRCPDR